MRVVPFGVMHVHRRSGLASDVVPESEAAHHDVSIVFRVHRDQLDRDITKELLLPKVARPVAVGLDLPSLQKLGEHDDNGNLCLL